MHVVVHHADISPTNDLLKKFWEVQEPPNIQHKRTLEEHTVVELFQKQHKRTPKGRFIIPLPKKQDVNQLL